MSNAQLSTLAPLSNISGMDISQMLSNSSTGMPLTTIPEMPGDEGDEEEENRRNRRSFAEGYSHEERVSSSNRNSMSDRSSFKARRTSRLSINMTYALPSTPPLSTAAMTSSPFASISTTSSSTSISPTTNPYQWSSDLRQYIMSDIGPQPSNSQVPTLRNNHFNLNSTITSNGVVRRRSYSKNVGPSFSSPSPPSSSQSSPSLTEGCSATFEVSGHAGHAGYVNNNTHISDINYSCKGLGVSLPTPRVSMDLSAQ